jgi:two-component system response regulator FixJ
VLEKEQTIFVIEDDVAISNALKWLFESVSLNVETYENATLFLEKYDHQKLGCIIIDVRLPGMSGLELLERLKAKEKRIPVIVITGYGDIQMAVRAMKAGAVEFILKPFNDQCILETVQHYLNLTCHLTPVDVINNRINLLSSRERQISDLILDGKLNKQIAHELSISISTVEAHRAKIMKKMKVKNLAQFVKMYMEAHSNH